MNARIILLGLCAAVITSCSTAYKTGQTPDDVYYSPARESEEYVSVENNDDRRYRGEDRYRSNSEYVNPDDRWLRMRVRNRYRWSAFDEYEFNDWRYGGYATYGRFNSYAYSYNPYSSFNNYWNNYYSWNSYYNPYCNRVIILNPKTNPGVYNRVRSFNLNSYENSAYSNRNATPSRNTFLNRNPSTNQGYNNSNSGFGNSRKRVYSNSNSGRDTYVSPSSSDRPTRVYQPSSSSSSPSSNSGSRSSGNSGSSSGSSSGGGSGSRPSRGN